jgi:hypothetical protein
MDSREEMRTKINVGVALTMTHRPVFILLLSVIDSAGVITAEELALVVAGPTAAAAAVVDATAVAAVAVVGIVVGVVVVGIVVGVVVGVVVVGVVMVVVATVVGEAVVAVVPTVVGLRVVGTAVDVEHTAVSIQGCGRFLALHAYIDDTACTVNDLKVPIACSVVLCHIYSTCMATYIMSG